MRRSRFALACVLGVGALGMGALAPSSSVAAPTWLSSMKLSAPGQSAEEPQVAADGHGDYLAAWTRLNIVEASSKPAGPGAWQSPLAVSNGKEQASLPQIALDSNGVATAVWLSFDGAEYSIQAAERANPTGAWSTPVTLKKLGAMATTDPRPDLAVNARGDAVAVWMRYGGGVDSIAESAVKPAGAAAWGPVQVVSKEAVDMHAAEVGIDAAGDATADWEQVVAAETRVDTSARPAGGAWQTPIPVSPTGGAAANEPRLAENARGDVVAIWEHFYSEEIIEAATRSGPGGTWAKAVSLSREETGKGEPGLQQVALDGRGDAVAVWSRFDPANQDIVEAAAGQIATASWQPPVTISGKGKNFEESPQVGVDENGDAVAVWERWNGSNEVAEAVSGNAGSGTWGLPMALSSPGQEAGEAQVALDAQGDAAAVWHRNDGKASYIVEAAGYDAAGPLLNSLVLPGAGSVGVPLAFSVLPMDVWSVNGAVAWSFGDGSSASGASVTHTFSSPGTFPVTVIATDALGNASSSNGLVSIAPIVRTVVPPPPSAPRITGAHLSRTRFRVSRRPTAISAKARAPAGTDFLFTLSQSAKVQVAFQRALPGLISRGRCVAPSAKLRRRHARRCRRLHTVGALTRAREQRGKDRLPFSGRLGTRPLAPGAYTALVTASAGGLSSSPVRLALTVVP